MTFENQEVTQRTIRVGVSAGDLAAMIGDTQDPDAHRAMLICLTRIFPMWERLDFDWPKHFTRVLADFPRGDLETLRTVVSVLQESIDDEFHVRNGD